MNTRAFHGPGEAGDEPRHLGGIQPLDGRRLVGGESATAVGQADPVDVHQSHSARH